LRGVAVMGWAILGFIAGYLIGAHVSKKGRGNFIYIGPDREKYKKATIGILTKS
jgi:hypothetical protein